MLGCVTSFLFAPILSISDGEREGSSRGGVQTHQMQVEEGTMTGHPFLPTTVRDLALDEIEMRGGLDGIPGRSASASVSSDSAVPSLSAISA